jgi:hypothetical protein
MAVQKENRKSSRQRPGRMDRELLSYGYRVSLVLLTITQIALSQLLQERLPLVGLFELMALKIRMILLP